MNQCILTAAVVATLLMSSCRKDTEIIPDDNNFFGNSIPVGNGNARSFLTNANDHEQMELGFTLDAASLEGLSQHESNYLIDLPEEARRLTPYKHISLDWTPHGHEPNGVYDKPHFDIHFFMISRDEQNAITASNPDLQKLPDSSLMPPFYVPEPGGIDKMGKHWVDVTSPELNPAKPAPFTNTLIYGTYNAKVIFIEPMVTRDFFLSKPDTVMSIRQPNSFAIKSHYPTKYKIKFDKAVNKITVSLLDFEHR